MAELSSLRIQDLSKGVYSDVASSIAPSNSVKHSINFLFDVEYGAARVRLGSAIIGSQLVAEENSVIGLHNFRDRNGSNHALLATVNVVGDATATTFNAATGIAVRTGTTANAVHRFETFLDEVIMQDGTSSPLTWTGTGTFGSSTNLDTANAPIGIDVLGYKDRLWVLQANGVLRGSSIPAASSYSTISWTSGNKTIAIDPDQTSYAGEAIGLAKVSGLLLIFKARALYTFNGSATQADFLYNVGCSSVRSISTGAGIVFFFNPQGIWMTKGSEPIRISRPVQAYLNGMSSSNYSSVAGFSDGKYYWCSIGDVTIGLTTYSNTVLRYSISTQEWCVLSYATRPSILSQYINGTDVTVAFGDNTARCYTLDSGTTDNGTAIQYELISQELDFGSRGLLKDIHDKIVVYSKESSDAEIQIRVNGREFITVGHALSVVECIPLSEILKGNFFELRLIGVTTATSPTFYGFEFPGVSSSGYSSSE